jgi:hypothetical protein
MAENGERGRTWAVSDARRRSMTSTMASEKQWQVGRHSWVYSAERGRPRRGQREKGEHKELNKESRDFPGPFAIFL